MVTVGDYAVGQDAARKNELRLAVTAQLARQVLRVRMLGSAAIDLAWLAEGKTDACITLGSHPWDIAAGVIIATEAGAKIFDLDGAPHTLRAKATIAAAPALAADMIRLIAEAQHSPSAVCPFTTFSTASRARPPGAPAARPAAGLACGTRKSSRRFAMGGTLDRQEPAGRKGPCPPRERLPARSLRPEALRSRALPPGRLPRTRRQAARAPNDPR